MISKDQHQSLIQQAEDYRRQDVSGVNNRFRPMYHISPCVNWMNDPNGLVFFQGKYHVFYQYHPFSAHWGPMHWGHVVSDDLIHWETLPIALAPSKTYDEDGCFSGSAIEHAGRLYLFYTGHSDSKSPKEVQCMAMSEDGVTFEKYSGNPIISGPPADGSDDFRDPKVWKHDDVWYMVVGSGKDGQGRALLYRSLDLFTWDYVSVISESDGSQGYNWECPDVLSVSDNKDVLILSPEGMDTGSNLYMVGTMDYPSGKFVTEYTGQLDAGRDFYAPQSFQDGKGRNIVIGWMNMWNTPMPTQDDGWAGALTVPRQVELNSQGQLTFQPVSELKALRKQCLEYSDMLLTPNTPNPLADAHGTHLEFQIEYDLDSTDAQRFGVKFRCSEDDIEETVLYYDASIGQLQLNLEKSGIGGTGSSQCSVDVTDKVMRIRIFLDTSSVEIFVNEGVHVMTHRIYPHPASDQLELFSESGNTRITTFKMWTLEL